MEALTRAACFEKAFLKDYGKAAEKFCDIYLLALAGAMLEGLNSISRFSFGIHLSAIYVWEGS
jgi:hypothetical protein